MNRKHLAFMVWFSMGAWGAFGMAPTYGFDTCTQQDAREAETQVPTARSWDEIYRLYRTYGSCDDGAVAEGFSEAITLQLEGNWEATHRLNYLIRSDPKFLQFVVAHISASVPIERLVRIESNAGRSCSADLRELCMAIRTAASAASK